jgi:hypothetical protein
LSRRADPKTEPATAPGDAGELRRILIKISNTLFLKNVRTYTISPGKLKPISTMYSLSATVEGLSIYNSLPVFRRFIPN